MQHTRYYLCMQLLFCLVSHYPANLTSLQVTDNHLVATLHPVLIRLYCTVHVLNMETFQALIGHHSLCDGLCVRVGHPISRIMLEQRSLNPAHEPGRAALAISSYSNVCSQRQTRIHLKPVCSGTQSNSSMAVASHQQKCEQLVQG